MTIHCLFEQSGTFKRAAMRLGYEAEDYDILNDFGETDHQVDLFNEIRKAYLHKKSIFDSFTKEDIIFAFFPCTRFETQIGLHFRNENNNTKRTPEEAIRYSWKLEQERSKLYSHLCELFLVCMERGLRLIVENPWSYDHYLSQYFPIKPRIVDQDRTLLGDDKRKPTQYWFINLEPKKQLLLGVDDVSRASKERLHIRLEQSRAFAHHAGIRLQLLKNIHRREQQ